MRKLASARISYRDDFLISYRFYMMTGSFHISLFEGTLHVDKIHVSDMFDSKSQTLRMRYPFQSTGRPISHRNAFRVYMIPLRDFVPEWNSRPGTTTGVNSRRGDSRRHDILWWYHVNKYRAMRGNQSELAPAWKSLRRHVNTPLRLDLFLSSVATDCKDAHGLKLEKVGPDFSSFNAMPVKPTKNYYTQCSFVNLFDIFFITLQGHAFCVWVKALRNLSPNINILILQTDLYIFP